MEPHWYVITEVLSNKLLIGMKFEHEYVSTL